MATFFSPSGNPEEWLKKPDGYFTVSEWLAKQPAAVNIELTETERFAELRASRDDKIKSSRWYIERHSDEKLLGDPTSLTEEEVVLVLKYIQLLRKLPEQDGAPWQNGTEIPWPPIPSCMTK